MTAAARLFSGTGANLALLILRITLAVVFLAHGINHIFGGGKIAGTARWFESLGMKPGKLHAWTASLTEVGSGVLVLLGIATPLACAGMVGTMLVALITNHLKNGFFIFRPGEGYEYVMVLTMAAVALGTAGAGHWSLDYVVHHHKAIFEWLHGMRGFLVTVLAGGGGALGLLLVFWRKPAPAES